jgi:hypothetical protein
VVSAHRSRWPEIFRKRFSVSNQAEATQRSTIPCHANTSYWRSGAPHRSAGSRSGWSSPGFVQRGRQLEPPQGEHFRHSLPQAAWGPHNQRPARGHRGLKGSGDSGSDAKTSNALGAFPLRFPGGHSCRRSGAGRRRLPNRDRSRRRYITLPISESCAPNKVVDLVSLLRLAIDA